MPLRECSIGSISLREMIRLDSVAALDKVEYEGVPLYFQERMDADPPVSTNGMD